MKHNKCGICGANLDAGERCDCRNERKKQAPTAAATFTRAEALEAVRAIKSILTR